MSDSTRGERVTDFDFAPKSAKYPWDEWLDGSVWRLAPEDMGNQDPSRFQGRVYLAAKKRGMKARSACRDGFLYVQAIGPRDTPSL